jgi:ATP-dependent Clp protease ATP-binding subunit ClpB
MFNPLGQNQLRHIIDNQVQLISKRLEDRDISISVDDCAAEFVLQQSYDPAYGARPLRRYLEKNLVTRISRGLFTHEIPNHSHVTISSNGKELTLIVELVERESSSGADDEENVYIKSTSKKGTSDGIAKIDLNSTKKRRTDPK